MLCAFAAAADFAEAFGARAVAVAEDGRSGPSLKPERLT